MGKNHCFIQILGESPQEEKASKSFVNMKKAVDDDLTVSKLSLHCQFDGNLFRKYQCDTPMTVFMFKD